MKERRINLSGASALAIMLMSMSGVARAQDAVPDQTESGKADIVVTGSRIAQPGVISPSPIATIDAAQFKQTGSVTLEDTLNRLPQLVPARGATSNDGLTGGVTTLNLRGLGSNRTLVLMDSRRVQAASPFGDVDINNIPSALIRSVDVVTGGSSAAYGSDAIAGVVNFKLDHEFTGVQLDLQTGITSRGDGFQTQGSLTMGGAFDDERGHAQLSFSYAKRDGIPNRARDFSQVVRPSSNLPTGAYIADATNLPTQAAMDSVFGRYGQAAGAVPDTARVGFNGDGSLFSFQSSALNYKGGAPGMIVSPDGIRFNSSGVAGLTIPYERVGAYAHVDYDVADDINVYGEFNFAHFTSTAYYAPGFTTVAVPVANPFVPADLKTILASRTDPTADFGVARRFAEVGFRTAKSATDNFQVRLGATGSLGVRDWTWDIYGSYGHSDQRELDLNGFSVAALETLIAAADGGASLCAGGLNPFGPQANTACADYIRRDPLQNATGTQKVVEATLQGSLFTLPAGDLRFALGADYRSDSFSFIPDAALRSGDIVTFSSGAIPPIAGEINAKEVYGELSVPLLQNLPLIRKLTAGLGYRYSDYNRAGSVQSYRADGNWEVFDALRIRGGYARSIRSPSIAELFSPTSQTSPEIGLPGPVGRGDPCDVRSAYRTGSNAAAVRALCLAQGVPSNIIDSYTFDSIQITEGGITGGNLNLKPEKADTFTVGAVLTPTFDTSWFKGLTLSVDYYDIRVKDAVATIGGSTAIQRCFNLNGNNPGYSQSSVYCGLFGRSGNTGQINSILLNNLNLGAVKTSGVDILLNWVSDLDGAGIPSGGRLAFNASATRFLHYYQQTLPGEDFVDYAGAVGQDVTAFPDWKANASVAYSNGPVVVTLQYRFIDGMIDSSVVGLSDTSGFDVPSRSYVDLDLNIKATDRMTFRLGVNNLTDKAPPVISSFDQSNTMPTVYDVFGRSFYAGVTARF